LEEEGLQSASLKILEDEMTNNKEWFLTLTEAHFEKLLPLLEVGQHALYGKKSSMYVIEYTIAFN
jgi:hypothetical protein